MGTEMRKVEEERKRIFELATRAVEYTLSSLEHFSVFGDTLHARIALEYALEYLGAAKIALKELEGLLEREKEAKG
jgi:hypothetical protein